MNKLLRGFTIVELVVSIVIIGILASIGIASYNRIQIESRDSQREAAVTTIMGALEKFYEKNGEYPYREALNPNAESPKLLSYDPVINLLPDLTPQILSTGGYNFYPFRCADGSTGCTGTSTSTEARKTQFFYYTAYTTSTNGYVRYSSSSGLWGCEMVFNDTNPAAIIAWKREQDGKWIFKRSKHGIVDIHNYSTGPVAPTTCTFS